MISLLRGLHQPVVLVGATAFALLWTLALLGGFFGLWLLVIVAAALIRYPYELTASAAEGAAEPPPAEVHHFTPAMSPQYLLHALTLGALAWWLSQRAGLPALTVGLIMASVAPATIALMGGTGSFLTAVNPLGITQLVIILGWDYLRVILLVLGAWVMVVFTDRLVDLPILTRFATLYALFVTFDLCGRVLHHRRRDIPFVASTYQDRREIRDRQEEQRDVDLVLDRIYRILREGDTAGALLAISKLVEAQGYRLEAYELLYARVREWQLPEVTVAFTRLFAERLVLVGQIQRAMEVTEACLRQHPDFRPSPQAVAAIVAHARSMGHERTAELLTMASER